MRVGRHSRQRGAWYARGNRNKYFRKGNISDFGKYERLEGKSGNEGRSQRRKLLIKHQVVCVHSCSESAEKGRLTKAEGCLGCSRQEIK